jgi:Tol biopolymer transport system component
MGGEKMRKVEFLLFTTILCLCVQTLGEGIRRPIRLTAGSANQFLGVLSPDGKTLYFVSDRASTTQVFSQSLKGGAEKLVFEVNGDTTMPKPSPDGKKLIFISFRDDAEGDVCVFDIGKKKTNCLTDSKTADLQAFWFPDSSSVGVLQRRTLHGDFILTKVYLDGRSDLLLERNISNPSISPDGKFLVYIPIEKGDSSVGVSFLMRPGKGLDVMEISSKKTWHYDPPLPGFTSHPSFSPDFSSIYFTQYLNDTNLDGKIDGNDHGVVFRVSIERQGDEVVFGEPLQLTSAGWNCQYPAPSKEMLIVTCSKGGSLDVFSLPLDGSVGVDLDVKTLLAQMTAARDHYEKMLLLGRAIEKEREKKKVLEMLRRMAHAHLEVKEFSSARFYASRIMDLAKEVAQFREWGMCLEELAKHREAEAMLVQGEPSERFIAKERERLKRIDGYALETKSGKTLCKLVKSEVADVLGDEEGALREFLGVDFRELEDRETALVWARRGDSIYRIRADFDGLRDIQKKMATASVVDYDDRFFFADAYVKTLLNGKSKDEQAKLVEEEFLKAEEGSEIRFRLALERYLLQLGKDDKEELRKKIFEIYKENKELERRKALVLTTAERALKEDEEYILYQFTNSFVSWLKRAEPERHYAESLYRDVILERAYAKWAKGEIGDARGLFFAVTLQTDSIEAHLGAIENRLMEGASDILKQYEERYKKGTFVDFAKAYLIIRGLEKEGARFEAMANEALGLLDNLLYEHPNDYEPHMLYGYVALLKCLRTNDAIDCALANRHLYLALDLANENPRAVASIRILVGLLEAHKGNHRGALRHFAWRESLPFKDKEAVLALKYLKAKSEFLGGLGGSKTMEEAKAIVFGDGERFGAYKAIVLDKLALYYYAEGRFEQALRTYEMLVALGVDGWNKVKAHIALGASALGVKDGKKALDALEVARQALSGLSEPQGFQGQTLFSKDDYRGIIEALSSHALATLGRFSEAIDAMNRYVILLKARVKKFDLDEDVLRVASAEFHLARFASMAKDWKGALEHVREGLRFVKDFSKRTGTEVTAERVGLALKGLEILVQEKEIASQHKTLIEEGENLWSALNEARNPRFDDERFLIGLYLSILDVSRKGGLR